MSNYLEIATNVLKNGEWKENRTGVKTLTNFCEIYRHDMSKGFPLLTTKKMAWKTMAVELEGFINGITDKRWYQDKSCRIWDSWSNLEQLTEQIISEDLKNEWQIKNPDLGPLGYSHQWRNFNGQYTPIPFIWTDKDKKIKVTPSDEKLVGETFNGKYGQYTVISYDGKDKNHNKKFTIKFKDSGFTKNNVSSNQIKNRNVLDPYYPQICGVAAVGDYKWIPMDKKIVSKLMNQWRQMVQRCYNPNHSAYSNYGGRGVWVSNRWLVFEYFLLDIQQIRGWDSKLKNWRDYQLDKDIKGGNKYSKETCMWVTVSDNANHTRQNYYFDAVSPRGILYENVVGLARFCRKHSLKVKNVEASIQNDAKIQGWKFTRKQNLNTNHQYYGEDQLKDIIHTLQTNPNDRRMIVSAWNPNQMNRMALPPCHYSFNLVHINGKLNLVWTQRSCDLFLGVPFNIASYALLLTLLCKTSGLVPGELVGTLHDCHIYENHIPQMREQINRKPYPFPEVSIESNDIFSWTHEDLKFIDYNHHPPLKGKVAV